MFLPIIPIANAYQRGLLLMRRYNQQRGLLRRAIMRRRVAYTNRGGYS